MTEPLASTRPQEHRIRGIGMRVAAMSMLSITAACVKLTTMAGASLYEVLLWRSLGSLPVVLIWMMIGPGIGSARTKRIGAHAKRTALGFVAGALSYQAIVMLPLAEATAISFTAPLFATILSALLLSETVGPHRWAAIAVGMIGVLIVMRPGFSGVDPAGLLIGLVAALTFSGVTIAVRQIGLTEAAATTVFWYNIMSLALLAPGMFLFSSSHPTGVWALLALTGATGGIAQMLMAAALRYAPVSVLAPFEYIQLAWAVLIAWLLWSDRPSPAMLAGAMLIAASGLYIAFREHRLMVSPPV